jgi:DNA-binding PadR family transcriptional regulator
MPGRILGFYALSAMEVDGPLYGYQLAERIADRTDGAWRPGAGAIYPALDSLTRRKLARVSSEGRRRVYRITPQGRAALRDVRRNMAWRMRGGPDLSLLWAEIAGSDDPDQFLLDTFRRRLDRVVGYFARDTGASARSRAFRSQLLDELRRAEDRLCGADPPRSGVGSPPRSVEAR